MAAQLTPGDAHLTEGTPLKKAACLLAAVLPWEKLLGNKVLRGRNHGRHLSCNYLESAQACPEIKKCGPMAIKHDSFLQPGYFWATASRSTMEQGCQLGYRDMLGDAGQPVPCLPRVYEQAHISWGLRIPLHPSAKGEGCVMIRGRKNAGGRETPQPIKDSAGPWVAVNKCIMKGRKWFLTILQHLYGRAEDGNRASLNTDLASCIKCVAKRFVTEQPPGLTDPKCFQFLLESHEKVKLLGQRTRSELRNSIIKMLHWKQNSFIFR